VNKGETMRLCRFFLRGAAVAAWACLVGPAAAQTPGRLILVDAPGISGDIVAVSPIGVEIDVRGEAKKVPIESIREVTFAGEPQSLRAARVAVNRGQPAQALEDIAKIEPGEMDGVDQLIADELEFVKAAAVGGQAAASGENIAAGLKAVQGYVGKHPQTHHLFAMQELLARLLSRSGKFDEAAAALAPLDRGPPAYRVRAAAARAGLFYDQKKYDDAAREYAAAAQATTDPKDTASAAQKRAAELGVARCRSRLGKPDEAVAIVDRVLAASGADDTEVLGAAYNALGDAMRAAGKDQDAIIAYLTVDLVHNKAPENRAEALFNLVELWDKGKSPQRAEEARQQLLQAYPDTVWARKLAAPKGS
jgi:tetratricopeptide (TPR) repeat protein